MALFGAWAALGTFGTIADLLNHFNVSDEVWNGVIAQACSSQDRVRQEPEEAGEPGQAQSTEEEETSPERRAAAAQNWGREQHQGERQQQGQVQRPSWSRASGTGPCGKLPPRAERASSVKRTHTHVGFVCHHRIKMMHARPNKQL